MTTYACLPLHPALLTSEFYRRLCCGVAAFLAFAAADHADAQTIVYDNLSTSSSNPVQNFSGITKLGQSFTPTGAGLISSITLNLSTTNPVPVFALELWSDNGGATHLPSTLLTTLVSNQSWGGVSGASQDSSRTITFPSSGYTTNYSVALGTTYWLVISTTSGSAKAWGVSETLGEPSAKFTGSWSSLSLSGSLGAEVAISAIPEPSTYAALAGFGTMVYAAYRRRTFTKSSAAI